MVWQHHNYSNVSVNLDDMLDDNNNQDDTRVVLVLISYCIIFLLAVVGNTMVLITLLTKRSMRTVTNILLLNLSIADLLFAVINMPSTAITLFAENFIFCSMWCQVLHYCEGVTVAVSSLTLTLLSLERYYAICKPLQSRKWQTTAHAYTMLVLVWILSAICITPTLVAYQVVEIKDLKRKCWDTWRKLPRAQDLRFGYMVMNVVLFFVIPLSVMMVAYGCIIYTLYHKPFIPHQNNLFLSQIETKHGNVLQRSFRMPTLPFKKNKVPTSSPSSPPQMASSSHRQLKYETDSRSLELGELLSIKPNQMNTSLEEAVNKPMKRTVSDAQPTPSKFIRISSNNRALKNKKKIITMLLVIVMAFFICWTPTFVLYIWDCVDRRSARYHVPPGMHHAIILLAFTSTICNPITYCFMNDKFRNAFLDNCCRLWGGRRGNRHRSPHLHHARSGYASASIGNVTGGRSFTEDNIRGTN